MQLSSLEPFNLQSKTAKSENSDKWNLESLHIARKVECPEEPTMPIVNLLRECALCGFKKHYNHDGSSLQGDEATVTPYSVIQCISKYWYKSTIIVVIFICESRPMHCEVVITEELSISWQRSCTIMVWLKLTHEQHEAVYDSPYRAFRPSHNHEY